MRKDLAKVVAVVGLSAVGLGAGGCGPETEAQRSDESVTTTESKLDVGTVVQITCTGTGKQSFSFTAFTLPGPVSCTRPAVIGPPTPVDPDPGGDLYRYQGCATVKIANGSGKPIVFMDNTTNVVRHIQGTAAAPTLSIYATNNKVFEIDRFYYFNFQNGLSTLELRDFGQRLLGSYTSTCQLTIW